MKMQIAMPQQDQNKSTPFSDDMSNYSNTDVETGDNHTEHNKKSSHLNVSARSTSGTRRRTQLWYTLGLVSVLVLVAVVVVAVVVFRGPGSPLTPQQQQLLEIVDSISSKKDLQNSASPQHMAYNWLIHQDAFYNDADNIPTELAVQRYVLAVFYYATMGHQKWVSSSNWLQGNECLGNWFGISCNDQGHVHTLKFESNGLVGTLPRELGHLTKLENLVLRNEKGITGNIPATLANIPTLHQLTMDNNKLEGSIPQQLYTMSSLRYINFENNALNGSLSSDVALIRGLEALVLSKNQLQGQIPWESLASTRITYLGLGSNKFSGTIDDEVRDCRDLQYLYVDNNELVGELPVAIGELSNLRSIDLGSNGFQGRFPSVFGRLENLRFLSAPSNKFAGPLPSELRLLKKLKTLNLAANQFSGSIPDFSTVPNLKSLILEGNQFQ